MTPDSLANLLDKAQRLTADGGGNSDVAAGTKCIIMTDEVARQFSADLRAFQRRMDFLENELRQAGYELRN